MNLYDLSIPQLTRMLGQVHRWLDKAQAHAKQKTYDPQVLLSARLAPDQWPLARQIQTIALAPRRISALLRGVEPPPHEDGEATMADVRARLDVAIEHLKTLKPDQFDGAQDRIIPLPFLTGKGMSAPAWLIQFALPNFYFHLTTAYAILRHNGVDLGKVDFLGDLDIRDL